MVAHPLTPPLFYATLVPSYFVPFLLISAMDHVPPFLLCVCFFLTGQGSHALYTAALMTSGTGARRARTGGWGVGYRVCSLALLESARIRVNAIDRVVGVVRCVHTS